MGPTQTPPDFVLVPDPDPSTVASRPPAAPLLAQLRDLGLSIGSWLSHPPPSPSMPWAGAELLQDKRGELPGTALLLRHLKGNP